METTNDTKFLRNTFLFLAVSSLIIAAVVYILMHPTVTIENMSWSTEVPIYKTITVTKEGWELPAGAKLISAEKKAYQESATPRLKTGASKKSPG